MRQQLGKRAPQAVDACEICVRAREAGSKLVSNYISGFQDDTLETMQHTLPLAPGLTTEMAPATLRREPLGDRAQ